MLQFKRTDGQEAFGPTSTPQLPLLPTRPRAGSGVFLLVRTCCSTSHPTQSMRGSQRICGSPALRAAAAFIVALACSAYSASAAYFYVQESQDKCFIESVPTGVALTASYKNHENPGKVQAGLRLSTAFERCLLAVSARLKLIKTWLDFLWGVACSVFWSFESVILVFILFWLRRDLQHYLQGPEWPQRIQQGGASGRCGGESYPHDNDNGGVSGLHFLRFFQVVQYAATQVVPLY